MGANEGVSHPPFLSEGGTDMSTTTFPSGWFNFDEDYLRKLLGNDTATTKHFFDYFLGRLSVKARRNFERKEDVEDIVQETFARVFAALRAEKLRDARALPAFMVGFCELISLEKIRDRGKFRERHADFNISVIVSRALNPEEYAIERSNRKLAEDAMSILEESDRRLLSRVRRGDDTKVIAADFHMSVEGVKSRKHRAMREARLYFKQRSENRNNLKDDANDDTKQTCRET
jgi:DNA-directed RNA polymerase specialized sigma24 family protein